MTDATALFMRIKPWKEFRSEAKHLFPTDSALRWFLRTHDTALAQAGAVVKLRRGLYIDPPIFMSSALDLLREASTGNGASR